LIKNHDDSVNKANKLEGSITYLKDKSMLPKNHIHL